MRRVSARLRQVLFGRLNGQKQNKCPPLFDRDWYLAEYADVAQSRIDPWRHFLRHGATEGRHANPFFDTHWYLENNPDVASSTINPLVHYWRHGALEGRDPHPGFSTGLYLSAYGDVANAGYNPLFHYLKWGRAEGRAIWPSTIDGDRSNAIDLLAGCAELDVPAALDDLLKCLRQSEAMDIQDGQMLEKYKKLLSEAQDILKKRGMRAVVGAGVREVAGVLDPSDLGPASNTGWVEEYRSIRSTFGDKVALASILRHLANAAEGNRRHSASANRDRRAARSAKSDYEYTYELTKEDGVVPSRRPRNDADYALEVPFGFDRKSGPDRTIAIVLHCFYPDVLPEMLRYFDNIPLAADIFISTDTAEKREQITDICQGSWQKGTFEVRVFENRGRDIAPKFVGFRDVYARYELFLHAHSKRSPHGGEPLARWRDYLLENICGSQDIVESILTLFDDDSIGVVFPQHLFELRGILNWGYDYDLARALLDRVGVKLDKDMVLEFPSGSMFWGRSEAIRGLLDLELAFEDFPEEAGQIDGTLAHAIERSMLFAVESAGFEWRKVVKRDLYEKPETVLRVDSPTDLIKWRHFVFQPVLTRPVSGVMPSERAIPETRAILTYPSRNERPRLNLLVPTVNPSQTFGGISTAIKVFGEIADALGYDRRIVSTCAPVQAEAVERFSDYTLTPMGPSSDTTEWSLTDVFDRSQGRLDLRPSDVFVATAWWTARFAFEFNDIRRASGKTPPPVIYLIQDDEPNFYGWSSKWSLAEATYKRPDETIAIINSEELFSSITERYQFSKSFCLPYQMNGTIKRSLRASVRERTIIIYGRPSVTRNAFELVVDALFLWQQRNPSLAAKWSIVSLGEEYSRDWALPAQNFSVVGKASLQQYAAYLSTASVGISLMISPHPSYPPLEMAEAGLLTIANNFSHKRLEARYGNILPVEILEPATIAEKIEIAIFRAEKEMVGQVTVGGGSSATAVGCQVYDPIALAEIYKKLRRLDDGALAQCRD